MLIKEGICAFRNFSYESLEIRKSKKNRPRFQLLVGLLRQGCIILLHPCTTFTILGSHDPSPTTTRFVRYPYYVVQRTQYMYYDIVRIVLIKNLSCSYILGHVYYSIYAYIIIDRTSYSIRSIEGLLVSIDRIHMISRTVHSILHTTWYDTVYNRP